jgi:hypothetical protein
MSKWTKEELDYVNEKFKKGLSAEEISSVGKKEKKLERSPLSVEYKVYPELCGLLENGKSYEDVAKLFNRTAKDVKTIEKKYNEIKKDKFPTSEKSSNNDSSKTMYTNVGGYVLNNTNIQTDSFDLNELYDVNRKMDAMLNFYENYSRLNKLKSEKIITENFYTEVSNRLNEFKFNTKLFVNDLISNDDNDDNDDNNNNNNDKTETKKSTKYVSKNVSKNDSKNDSDSDDVEIEIPVKKFNKRLI